MSHQVCWQGLQRAVATNKLLQMRQGHHAGS
jgi:hypothetical protein